MRQAGITGLVGPPSAAGRRSAFPASGSARTSSTARSWPRRRTGCGSPTSPTSEPGRAGCTSSPSRTSTRRRIVGWAMADHMRTELVTDALQMALAQRRPAPGLIWHSDQGSQFVSPRLRSAGPRRRHRPIDGQPRRLLRQRRRRELLRHAQEGTHPRPLLADQGRTAHRGLRVHRGLLQPPPPALHARVPLPAASSRRSPSHNHRGSRQSPKPPLSTEAGELQSSSCSSEAHATAAAAWRSTVGMDDKR